MSNVRPNVLLLRHELYSCFYLEYTNTRHYSLNILENYRESVIPVIHKL